MRDKFNYPRSLLEESAYDSIAGLLLTAANYVQAIDILKKDLETSNKSGICDILLSAESVTSANNLKGVGSSTTF
jgi:Zn-dependent alcohol dehydrogenase